MSFEIYATKRFLKEFSKLPFHMQGRIKERLNILKEDPTAGIPLTAGFSGKYKFRVGNYRIIYEIDFEERKIYLMAVGHRKIIYKREER